LTYKLQMVFAESNFLADSLKMTETVLVLSLLGNHGAVVAGDLCAIHVFHMLPPGDEIGSIHGLW
jgi:hypothetical protein